MPQEATAKKPSTTASKRQSSQVQFVCPNVDMAATFDLEFKNRMLNLSDEFREFRGETKEALRVLNTDVEELRKEMQASITALQSYNIRVAVVIAVLMTIGLFSPHILEGLGKLAAKLL